MNDVVLVFFASLIVIIAAVASYLIGKHGSGGGGGTGSGTGYTIVPSAKTGAALQAAIDSVPSGGATVFCPRGTYGFGTTGVTVPQGKHKIHILCEAGTIFHYTGAGTALTVGGDAQNTEHFRLSGCEISIRDNYNVGACCLKLVRCFWGLYEHIKITSDNGTGTPVQTGVMVSGGATDQAGFSAYNTFINPALVGSFKTGFWFGSEIPGGPSTRDRSNSNIILGGSVYCGAASKITSIGVHIEHGDTNRVFGTDHDSLEVGILIEGHNNQVNCRFENIVKYAIQVKPTSQGSFLIGPSIPLNEFLDEGFETQMILTSQAGENKSVLTDAAARYSFTLVPRDGDPPNVSNGMLWYDWGTNTVKVRMNGQTRTLAVT